MREIFPWLFGGLPVAFWWPFGGLPADTGRLGNGGRLNFNVRFFMEALIEVGLIIADCLHKRSTNDQLKKRVKALADQFPLYPELRQETAVK